MNSISNYDKQCEDWRQRFLTMNQDDICNRLPEIERTDDELFYQLTDISGLPLKGSPFLRI